MFSRLTRESIIYRWDIERHQLIKEIKTHLLSIEFLTLLHSGEATSFVIVIFLLFLPGSLALCFLFSYSYIFPRTIWERDQSLSCISSHRWCPSFDFSMSLIQSSSSHLFNFVMIFIILLCINLIDCRHTHALQNTLPKGRLSSIDPLSSYDKATQGYGSITREDLIAFIREALKNYPDRRSSFHAMRGRWSEPFRRLETVSSFVKRIFCLSNKDELKPLLITVAKERLISLQTWNSTGKHWDLVIAHHE